MPRRELKYPSQVEWSKAWTARVLVAIRQATFLVLWAFLVFQQAEAGESSTLPSRHAATVLPLLKGLAPRYSLPNLESILGKPDMDIGSGIYAYVFRLDDSTAVEVGASSPTSLLYIKRTGHGIHNVQVIFARNESFAH